MAPESQPEEAAPGTAEDSSLGTPEAVEKTLGAIRETLARLTDPAAVRRLESEWLIGKGSRLRARFAQVRTASDPASLGAALSRFKSGVEAAVRSRLAELEGADRPRGEAATSDFDPTVPGRRSPRGSIHPLTRVTGEILQVFAGLGFEIVTGPEVEDPAHNFDGLNIPEGHPARDPSENFTLPGGFLLRSQTSPVQVRVLESRQPPLRILAPGRVYRPDTVDARHLYAFHQVEGLCIGEGVCMADLKGTLAAFAGGLYGAGARTRFRPSYFPFTEPSAEMDVSCFACGGAPEDPAPGGIGGGATGTGAVATGTGGGAGGTGGSRGARHCSTCGGEGWMELLGCGMVHPSVLRRSGHDPERWTGFAFGMGIERAAMRRWGIRDLRAFVENDVRFLAQFP